jgi:signal transduction histidine kinase
MSFNATDVEDKSKKASKMAYNLYVIVSDIVVSMMCGAIAMLLWSQLRRDRKARIFLTFAMLECIAEANFTIARIFSLLDREEFIPFFYVATVIYTTYPHLLLTFVCELFGLWSPFRRSLARALLLIPVLAALCVITSTLFANVYLTPGGFFNYNPTVYALILLGIGELCILYALILALTHALSVKMREQRQLIFGVIVVLVTALILPSQALFRTFGALGTIVGILLITNSVLRYRLFDPLTQANKKLKRQRRRLRQMDHTNKKLLRQLEEANVAKSRFIGYISHEVRNSITPIFTASQSIIEHPYLYNEPLPEDYEADILRIYNQVSHTTRLINDLLDMSRIDAGELRISPAPLDPTPVLEEVQQALSGQLQAGVVFERQYESLPDVWADKTRLTQILMNIVGNAAKFTKNGRIILSAQVEPNIMRFRVADTGRGMSQYVLTRLFQPYLQDLRDTDRALRGTGLGLSISKRLVELHGGTITVTSKVDEGTVIEFTIPLAVVHTSTIVPIE